MRRGHPLLSWCRWQTIPHKKTNSCRSCPNRNWYSFSGIVFKDGMFPHKMTDYTELYLLYSVRSASLVSSVHESSKQCTCSNHQQPWGFYWRNIAMQRACPSRGSDALPTSMNMFHQTFWQLQVQSHGAVFKFPVGWWVSGVNCIIHFFGGCHHPLWESLFSSIHKYTVMEWRRGLNAADMSHVQCVMISSWLAEDCFTFRSKKPEHFDSEPWCGSCGSGPTVWGCLTIWGVAIGAQSWDDTCSVCVCVWNLLGVMRERTVAVQRRCCYKSLMCILDADST